MKFKGNGYLCSLKLGILTLHPWIRRIDDTNASDISFVLFMVNCPPKILVPSITVYFQLFL